MMFVWLLLGAFVCMGQSQVIYQQYGSIYNLWMLRKTHFIEFNPKNSSDVRTLWKSGDPEISEDKKYIRTYIYYMMKNLTQRDSGHYILRDKDMRELTTHTLEVEAITKDFKQQPGEPLSFTVALEPSSCNIYFFPESNGQPLTIDIVRQGKLQGGLDQYKCVGFELYRSCGISNKALQMACSGRFEVRDQNGDTALKVSLEMNQRTGEKREVMVEIVRHGWMQPVSDEYGCRGFDLLKPCGIVNEALQSSCSGRFEIRDHNGDTAFEMSLAVESEPYVPSYWAFGAGVALTSLFFCCVKYCCCGGSPAKEDGPETDAAEPAKRYQENDSEPSRLRPHYLSQPSETPKLVFSQRSLTRPLINQPSTVNVPPASPQINQPSTVNVPPASPQVSAPDPPTVPVNYDPALRFELKMKVPSALTSESPYSGVYISDKFNFR
ncbi:uncharacterized protein LOC126388883 isoform X5 [Epinephelus moara]|uniref:uncharacterized protein LOC126388883 isoform X5 n=1 Tax=Epinephelus moara TaxID=300413 RepID=UPI00214F3E34|nr:uncharacterized protein LOC126388883 isoform X5 [Epinephelus moara]